MTDIDKKLEAARAKAKEYGRLYGAKETADDYLKTTYAILYDDCVVALPKATVPERDAWIKRHDVYKNALERKQSAYADWKTAETYMKILFAEAEVWRTQQANNRYMDGAHR